MRSRLMSASALVLACSVADAPARQAEIVHYTLPAEITYPEGIAFDARANAIYTGSAVTSAIVRIAPDTRQATPVSKGGALFPAEPFPALLGMKVDEAGRLWLAGGRTGMMAVLDAGTGRELKRFTVPTAGKSLVNDVAVARGNAYFTDTFVPTLWRVPVKGDAIGELEPWVEFAGSPLEYGDGPNLNGIAATPDGRSLIVVQMNKGLLFRIGTEDRRITAIDTAGEPLGTADGLVLEGRTLYVVRQGEQEVVTLELSADLGRARVVNRFTDASLAWPATAARVGDRLLVVNTQFNQRQKGGAKTPFSIVGIPLARLAGPG